MTPSYRSLELRTDQRGVSRVTLARPQSLNAFDETMIAELTAVFSHLATQAGTRAIVLAAQGRAFSAGADIGWMERASNNAEPENRADAQRFAGMMQAIYECPKPVIARVQGSAYGGGVGLCCACDLVVAASHARFAVSEAKFGILPSVIGPYLNNALGKRHATRLALSAEQIDAQLAEKIGLVHEVCEADALDAVVERFVSQLLASGPQAQAEIKALFHHLSLGPIDESVRELTAATIARVRAGDEAKEGFAAFLAKRPPSWSVS